MTNVLREDFRGARDGRQNVPAGWVFGMDSKKDIVMMCLLLMSLARVPRAISAPLYLLVMYYLI